MILNTYNNTLNAKWNIKKHTIMDLSKSSFSTTAIKKKKMESNDADYSVMAIPSTHKWFSCKCSLFYV
jgi:hypothetical protein